MMSFRYQSLTEVTDWWLSISALFLFNMLSWTVKISNDKAQNSWEIMYPQYGASNVLKMPEYYSAILCFIIWNIDSQKEQNNKKESWKWWPLVSDFRQRRAVERALYRLWRHTCKHLVELTSSTVIDFTLHLWCNCVHYQYVN